MKKLCLIALCLVSFSMNSFACGCTDKPETTSKNNAHKCTCTCNHSNKQCTQCSQCSKKSS